MPRAKEIGSRAAAHRPREESELRQFVGASVRAISKRQIAALVLAGRRERPGYHVGRLLDELIAFGRSRRFKPGRF